VNAGTGGIARTFDDAEWALHAAPAPANKTQQNETKKTRRMWTSKGP
jgi:hypothetical protein